ncbi:hypothetical protein [Clostridium botulinum]|uniref:hypothetical protein n=1 Tax=Clostridium botulinum TaxID=1491 RepID=UPI001969BCB9|nr:hypothetical protein [Clostridium botulinum]
MPRIGVTIYDLLLSCPGDVIDLKKIVKECVDEFNRLYGNINNIKIEVKHWSTDSYPQSGGSPQEILNNQFIHKCDVCVALFANKFGTPTDGYDSGTEEEIEDMISSGKQVFLYFIERPVDSSTIDIDQLAKVRSFKEKYSGRGIYWTIKNDEEFRKSFLNHLTLYFLELISEPTSSRVTELTPKLEFVMNDGTANAKIEYSNFHNGKMFREKDQIIYEVIQKIKEIVICDNVECKDETSDDYNSIEIDYNKSEDKSENIDLNQLGKIYNTTKILNNIPGIIKKEYETVEISNNMKLDIIEYCRMKSIEIEEKFWYLGRLKKQIKVVMLVHSNTENLEGTEEERTKYKLIKELWYKIYEYKESFDFFFKMDNIPQLNCIIANNGTTYDEDIDIKILVPKGYILKVEDFPIPGKSCIDEINDNNFCEYLYCGRNTDSIDKYSNYPIQLSNKFVGGINMPSFNQTSASELYDKGKREYLKTLRKIFCYEYFEKSETDILKFKVTYLKQNTNMYLPSILFFRKVPQYIRYEIISKHMPEVVSGRLEVYE